MQGDKLFPRHKNVVGRRLRLRAPDRRCGDGFVHAGGDFGQSAATKFRDHSLAIGRSAMGKDVDQLALHPGGFGVPELNAGQLRLLLRGYFCVDAVGLNKVQGRPFLVSEIEEKIDELLEA